MTGFWTDEKVKRAAELWNDRGWSARDIGLELGCSRNAVIGIRTRKPDLFRARRAAGKKQRHSPRPRTGRLTFGPLSGGRNRVTPASFDAEKALFSAEPVPPATGRRPFDRQVDRPVDGQVDRAADRRRREIRAMALSFGGSMQVAFEDLAAGQCQWPDDLDIASEGSATMTCCGRPVIDRHARPGRRERTHCPHHFVAGGFREPA